MLLESSKRLCLDRAIPYQTSTVNSGHSLYETSFENATDPIMIEQRGGLCLSEISEITFTKTEPVDNESEAFQNITMALMNLKIQLFIKECDRLMQS